MDRSRILKQFLMNNKWQVKLSQWGFHHMKIHSTADPQTWTTKQLVCQCLQKQNTNAHFADLAIGILAIGWMKMHQNTRVWLGKPTLTVGRRQNEVSNHSKPLRPFCSTIAMSRYFRFGSWLSSCFSDSTVWHLMLWLSLKGAAVVGFNTVSLVSWKMIL